MRKNEPGQFSARWWKASQPKGLASAGKLELALKSYESAKSRFERAASADALKEVLDLLERIEDAAGKTADEARKLQKSNPEMLWTAQSLSGLDVAAERRSLQERAAAADDDEPALADPDGYKRYLRAGLRRLEKGPVNWGFVPGKQPIEHRLMLSISRGGQSLAAKAARELGRSGFTFGTATVDPDNPGTIRLAIEGKQLSGLARGAKKMLRAFRPLPFDDVVLFVDGKLVADLVDANAEDGADETDPDPAPEFRAADPALEARYEKLRPKILSLATQFPAHRTALEAGLGMVRTELDSGAFGRAAAALDKLEAIAVRLGGAAPPPPAATAAAADAKPKTLRSQVADRLRSTAMFATILQDVPQAAGLGDAIRAVATMLQKTGAVESEETLGEVGRRMQMLEAEVSRVLRSAQREEDSAIADAALRETQGAQGKRNAIALPLLALEASHAEAVANLEEACSTFAALPQNRDDPGFLTRSLLTSVRQAGDRVPPIDPIVRAVEGALDQIAASDEPAARREAAAEALSAIASCRTALDEDLLLSFMEDTDAGKFAIQSALAAALDDLEAVLMG